MIRFHPRTDLSEVGTIRYGRAWRSRRDSADLSTNTPEDMQYILNHSEVGVIFIDEYKNLLKILGITKNCPKLKKLLSVRPERNEIKTDLEIISWQKLYDLALNAEKN